VLPLHLPCSHPHSPHCLTHATGTTPGSAPAAYKPPPAAAEQQQGQLQQQLEGAHRGLGLRLPHIAASCAEVRGGQQPRHGLSQALASAALLPQPCAPLPQAAKNTLQVSNPILRLSDV